MTTGNDRAPAVVGCTSEKGPKRPLNADAFAEHHFHDQLAIAVVDGTGSTPEVAEFATLAAQVAVRVAARQTPMLAVLATSELNADPTARFPKPDGAIVVATAEPGGPWSIAWAGDCVAYSWRGDGKCPRLTSPHTEGQRLRDRGVDEEAARAHDHQIFNGIGRSAAGGVPVVHTSAPVIILASDGLRKLSEEQIVNVFAEYEDDLNVCAKELVAAARAAGSKDDITVVVATHSPSNLATSAVASDQ